MAMITVYITVLWYNFIPIWKLGLTGNTRHKNIGLFNAMIRKKCDNMYNYVIGQN